MKATDANGEAADERSTVEPQAVGRDPRTSRNVLLMVVFVLSMVIVLGLIAGGAILWGVQDELDAVDAYEVHFQKALAGIADSGKKARDIGDMIQQEELRPESVRSMASECSRTLQAADRELAAAQQAIEGVDESPEKQYLLDSVECARKASDALKGCFADSEVTVACYTDASAIESAHAQGDQAVNAAVIAANKGDFETSLRQADRATARYRECQGRIADLKRLQQGIDYGEAVDVFAAELGLAKTAQTIAKAGLAGSQTRYVAAIKEFNRRSATLSGRYLPESVTLIHWDDAESWESPLAAARENHDNGMAVYGY